MSKKKIFAVLLLWSFIVILILFFSGFVDRTPTIELGKGQKLLFTDKRPDIKDQNILLCIPAAFSADGKIIGHYSVGSGRKGTTSYNYTTIHLDNNTHFQQASLIKNHRVKSFTETKRRFRRALCKKDGKFCIVHSTFPITLTEFSTQLKDYDMAWNLDMGSYSYGWYRDENGLHHLGLSSFYNRNKQTNWIIIKKN